MGSGNTSQKSDEEDFVKVEDLPLQLTVMCEVCNNTWSMSASLYLCYFVQTKSWKKSCWDISIGLKMYLSNAHTVYAVTSGGASEKDCGGAAEQQLVCGDPQREHLVSDWAGGKCTGTQRARYRLQTSETVTPIFVSVYICVHVGVSSLSIGKIIV